MKKLPRSHTTTATLILAITAGHIHATTFTDVTIDAGVDYRQSNLDDIAFGIDFMTGGAAAADVDNDGYVDIFVTRLDAPDILFRNKGAADPGRFEDFTVTAGLTADLSTNGAAFADIDNDGDQDLYVTSFGGGQQHYLYINNGSGHFTEQGVERNAVINGSSTHIGTSTAFGDYDNDGYLDAFVSEWGFRTVAPPALNSGNRLLHNLGAENPGYFEDNTLSSGVYLDDSNAFNTEGSLPGTYAFSPIFADFNKDGHADLAIAGDFHTSRLYWNNGDETFTQSPGGPVDLDQPLPEGHSGIGTDENGMGATVADFNGDGLLDWFVTSIYDPDDPCVEEGIACAWDDSGNRMYFNNGDGTFTDVTDNAGVRDGGWGWGTTNIDYDNDGDQDLVMTNGFLREVPDEVLPFHTDQVKLWNNDGTGVFTEVATEEGLTDTGSGKGLLTLDFDNDGDLDIFIVNNNGHPVLYRNDSDATNAYVRLDLEGEISNRDGIGAYITLIADEGDDAQTIYLDGGSNYLSHNERIAHFGLGDRTDPIHTLTIQWPSGQSQTLHDVPINATHLVSEVPEPTTLAMLVLTTLVSARRRRPC